MLIPSDTIFTKMAYGGDCLYDYNLIYKVDSISTGKVNIHLEVLECVKYNYEGFLKNENEEILFTHFLLPVFSLIGFSSILFCCRKNKN
jgi:hypothetical protein